MKIESERERELSCPTSKNKKWDSIDSPSLESQTIHTKTTLYSILIFNDNFTGPIFKSQYEMSFVYCMVNIKLFIILYSHLIYECLSYQLRLRCKIFSITLRLNMCIFLPKSLASMMVIINPLGLYWNILKHSTTLISYSTV